MISSSRLLGGQIVDPLDNALETGIPPRGSHILEYKDVAQSGAYTSQDARKKISEMSAIQPYFPPSVIGHDIRLNPISTEPGNDGLTTYDWGGGIRKEGFDTKFNILTSIRNMSIVEIMMVALVVALIVNMILSINIRNRLDMLTDLYLGISGKTNRRLKKYGHYKLHGPKMGKRHRDNDQLTYSSVHYTGIYDD